MTVVIIGIILAIFGVAASLYQLNRTPDVAEALACEYWWMAWPM